MPKAGPSDDLRTRLLKTALANAGFDGWSDALIAAAAAKLKISPGAAQEAFPDGAVSLARYFSDWADAETLKKLTPKKLAGLRVRDKITLGVRTRLEILQPHKQALAAALSYMAHPPRGLQLPKMVWATADKLWWAAGDNATDYNHYTKRILLSGVLTSTTLYWLNDASDDHENTWVFLDRRIDNVLKIGQKIGQGISSLKKRGAAKA